MPSDRFASLRASLATLAIVGLLVAIGVVEGRFVNVRTPLRAVFVLMFWGGPALVYWILMRSAVGSVLLGLGLAISIPLLLRTVILTDSSTAGFGVFAMGVFLWVIVSLGLVFERALLGFSARRRPKHAVAAGEGNGGQRMRG